MAKSLVFFLALAASRITASHLALPPYGGEQDTPHTAHRPNAEQSLGDADGAAAPPHHRTQAFHYNPAIHVTPPHYAPSTSIVAFNGSVHGTNTSFPVVDASSSIELATSTRGASAAASDIVITEIVTSYTTYCPRATAFTVNNATYSANASAVLTVSHCPGGCRVTRAASEISKPTVTAVVSQYTTSLAGATTLSLHGTLYKVANATVLTISRCPGGCTVTTDLQSLIHSAQSAPHPVQTAPDYGGSFNATGSTPVTASLAVGGTAATTGSAATPTGYRGNSTAPIQQPQHGAAARKEFGYPTILLACIVLMF